MRAFPTLLVAVSAVVAGPAFAQSMANMFGMDHGAPATKTGKGVGVIMAIDAKANTVTIKHGAIPAVGWPAMTMTFQAMPATLLKGVRVGQKIGFDVRIKGKDAAVTSLQPR